MERNQRRAGWALLLPALLHNTLFIAVPTITALVLAFTSFTFVGKWSWVGLDNFVKMWEDASFVSAFFNTILFTLVVVPVSMGIALLIAIGLNQQIRGRSVFRTAFYIPVVTATVAVATVWLWIYAPSSGLANGILSFFGLQPAPWLSSPNTALGSLMIVGIWQGLGARMIVYLAALQGVSRELLEAASLDGAGRWQSFRHVTWPALAPAHMFVVVTAIVQSFQVFDLVYVTTKGGPIDSTQVLVLQIYENAFQGLHLGYASAQTVILLILIGGFVMLGRLTAKDES